MSERRLLEYSLGHVPVFAFIKVVSKLRIPIAIIPIVDIIKVIIVLEQKQVLEELVNIFESELFVDVNVLFLRDGNRVFLDVARVVHDCAPVDHDFQSEPVRVLLISAQVLIQSEYYSRHIVQRRNVHKCYSILLVRLVNQE